MSENVKEEVYLLIGKAYYQQQLKEFLQKHSSAIITYNSKNGLCLMAEYTFQPYVMYKEQEAVEQKRLKELEE